jgi:hypothetical protein
MPKTFRHPVNLLMSGTLLTALLAGAHAQESPRIEKAGEESLASYWPFGVPPKTWRLTNKAGRAALIVTHVTSAPNTLDLIFRRPLNPEVDYGGGGFHTGHQRYCENNGDPYLFLDQYIGLKADGRVHERHHIVSSRLILTPQGGAPIDLIANGTYARCGNTGQPYLRWNLDVHRYRLQAWGSLAENSRYRWYWDIDVTAPVQATNTCVSPQEQFVAIEVQEAWWTNFDKKKMGWSIGGGRVGTDQEPTGERVTYGRVDWHAKGHMPWYMVKSAEGHLMCVTAIEGGTQLPVGQLCSPTRNRESRDCNIH